METFIFLTVILGILSFLYFIFVKGFPWIASKYASYVFKGQVNITSLNFVRLTVRGITLTKNSFTLKAGEIALSPNFFSHGYSSLLIAKISKVHIIKSARTEENEKEAPDSNLNLQQIVSYVCYMRFLITFILEDVSFTVEGYKKIPDHDVQLHFDKCHIYPESTKNGFVSLIVETELAQLDLTPSLTSLSCNNLKINLEIGLFPAVIKSVEMIVSSVAAKVPVSFAAKLSKNGVKPKSTADVQESNHSSPMPDLTFFFKDFSLTILDEFCRQQENDEILARVTALHLVKSQRENTFGCSLDEFLIDLGLTDRPSMALQKILYNKTPESSDINWADFTLHSNLNEVGQVLRICDRLFPNNLTVKTVEFQLEETRSKVIDSYMQMIVSGGHFEQSQSDLSVRLLIHELSGRFGQLMCSTGVPISNFELDNIDLTYDKNRQDLMVTTSGCTFYLAPEPLSTLCRWIHQLRSRLRPKMSKISESSSSSNPKLRINLRTDKLALIFRLDNGLALKAEIQTMKVKLKGGAKALGCHQFVLSLNEPGDRRERRVVYGPSATIGLNSSPKHFAFSCNEQIVMNWEPLTHRVFFDVSTTVKKVLEENNFLSSHDDHTDTATSAASVQVTLRNGILMKMKLHDNGLEFRAEMLEFVKKGPNLWKLDVPSLVCGISDVFDEFITLFKFSVERVGNHELSRRHRSEIEGCVNAENSAVVICMVKAEFKFPYEIDVHHIMSTEFLGIFKWLKSLHGKTSTDWNAVHPDILIFAKEIAMEVQDDPFEVNLRENYELLEDEHFESMKRVKCLENKIEELKKTHIMIQTTKIEELFNNLTKKNAEIYVHRGKALREKGSKRTRLLSFNLSSTELLIFSDKSMAGKEAVYDFIQSVDSESPWVDDLSFTSAHYRWVHFECKSANIKLRDYPQTLADAKHILCWGRCAIAEQVPMERAVRNQRINQGRPYYQDHILERSLMSYKLYHDLAMDMENSAFAHGPCWEPTISQVSIAMSYVTGRAQDRDPSPPLSSWDKFRYLFHGRLLCSVKNFKLYFHTSLDPYNTTEEVELTLSGAHFDWTNALIKCHADLDLFVRTASKYDDCQLLHLPNLTLTVQLNWICMGNPNDHHSVMLCANEKLPEYSHNVEHDSYRAFRSMNVNVHLRLETRRSAKTMDRPSLEMYSSTIRWMESLKWLFSGASRPIRKGKVFKNFQPQKQSFFRHIKNFRLSLSLHQLQFDYWTSASLSKGVLINVAKGLSLSSEYSLKLLKVNDGLIHRPRSIWTTDYTNCQMGASDIWFQSITKIQDKPHNEKNFFFSLEEVQYNRDITIEPKNQGAKPAGQSSDNAGPQHFLTIVGARGAWTQSNRDMGFALYDSWRRAHILRNQMSPEGLKMINVQPNNPPQEEVIAPPKPKLIPKDGVGQLSLSNLATWHGVSTVEKMVPEAGDVCSKKTLIVYSEDQSSDIKKKDMEAITACSKEDIIGRNWLIRVINSQMLLKGCETQGHLILSAAKAELLSASHTPVWKGQALLSKNSWSGVLESMQYFATVIPDSEEVRADQIMWLTKDKIEDQETVTSLSVESMVPPEIVGNSRSDRDILSEFGSSADLRFMHQLQKIVTRCKCEFFYVTYGDDPIEGVTDRIPRRPDDSPWLSDKETNYVDAFSLIHYDLNVCTNSLQYSMILDVLNNLLLYAEPNTKSRSENYLRMKYQLMLSNLDDQRKPIIQLQSQIRQMVCQLRSKERTIFAMQQVDHQVQQSERLEALEVEVQSLKEDINTKSEELEIRLRCLNEFQMSSNQRHFSYAGGNKAELRRKIEIFFSRAQWRLNEKDGQLGIADVAITNFLYTKNILRDDSVEHLLEMGFVHVKNLLPNQIYVDVIHPSDLPKDVPLDRHTALRVFCREKAPVGGISVKDHFEINLVPLTLGFTHIFLTKIMAFCFPEKANNPDSSSEEQASSKDKKKKSHIKGRKNTSSNFYVESPLNQDDVEEMKVRAQQNKLFVYIKIPEVPLNLSYKGEKEKNKILDVGNFLLQVPTIEYHNVTWTWLDLSLAVKNQIKDSLISQAIKQKLSIRQVTSRTVGSSSDAQNSVGDDDMKAKLLLGTRPLLPKVPGKKS